MTYCALCYKLSELNGPDTDVHGDHYVCRNEWKKRVDTGMCVTCGKNKAVDDSTRNARCSDHVDHQLDYSGYGEGI